MAGGGGGAWSLDLSTSSPSYISQFKDLSLDFEEGDVEEDLEYPCPFCSDDYYDLVDLCGHIDDEHPEETDFGVCPVCDTSVGVNMVDHITMQHGSIFKSHYKLKLHKQLSSIRKDTKDDYMQYDLASRSSMVTSSNTVPDPFLSFISNLPSKEASKSDQPGSSSAVPLLEEESSDNSIKRAPLSDKDREETTSRCDFVQGLMLSLFLDDNL